MQQLITSRKVLIGPVGQHISDGAVLIDGDTITAVGPRAEVERQLVGEVRRRDYPHHTLLPGLIDCHVHLAFDTSDSPIDALRDSDDLDLLMGMTGRAQQVLSAGVTTVRDLGDRDGLVIRLRDAIARGDVRGPRILAAGAPLTIPEGHCWFFGGAVAGDDEIRRQVRHNAALGADVIKVMASGGQITPNSPSMRQEQFSTDELRVIVEEATRAGLPVAAHAHSTEAITSAVAAGVTTVEHCTWMRAEGGGYDQREAVAKQMAADGVYACIAWPSTWRVLMDAIGPDRADQIAQRFRWMDELGVPLITGTDAGLRNAVFDDFAGALQVYEFAGFSTARIIEMATATSAAALGLGGNIGRISPGFSADLLVVDGDPLDEGLTALRDPRLILARGCDVTTAAPTPS